MPDAQQAQPWLSFLLGPFGLTVGLLALVYALATERLVPGKTHRRVLAQLDRAMHVTRRAVDMADPRDEEREGS